MQKTEEENRFCRGDEKTRVSQDPNLETEVPKKKSKMTRVLSARS
jgi:hypothetical protein